MKLKRTKLALVALALGASTALTAVEPAQAVYSCVSGYRVRSVPTPSVGHLPTAGIAPMCCARTGSQEHRKSSRGTGSTRIARHRLQSKVVRVRVVLRSALGF